MTQILTTIEAVKAFQAAHSGKTLGFVPTMGNLHDGHLSLMNIARTRADVVIASIFVNPTQFAPNEDLDSYPRTFEADLEKLKANNVEAVFYPQETTLYPYGKDRTLTIELPDGMTNILCGLDRPTHFQGVAIVVAKLFQIIRPHVAIFGEKDFQQLAIIRRLATELFMDIDIIGAPIVREASGLAMSSRNQYLSSEEREQATWLSKTLIHCREQLLAGESTNQTLTTAKQQLAKQAINVEYLDCRDIETLSENPDIKRGVLLIAARIGKTRLIDNLRIQ